ncbi:hypothetical protein BVX97_04145 [bacterium E08(2017)]|nr:hypothetical protein BVX97_04145 [bacterium E08(2017)]
MKRINNFVLGLAALLILTGCASYPPPSEGVSFAHYRRFNPDNVPTKVKDSLSHGDEYRQLVIRAMGEKTEISESKVYWYSEEGIKFYRHVLDILEPHNAYAAVCIGHLYILRGRVAPEHIKEVQFSSARNWLEKALESRKGYSEAHRFMGELCAINGEWNEAARQFSLLEQSGFRDSHIYAWRGYVLKKMGRDDEAKMAWQKAVHCGFPEDCATWARKSL